MISIGLNVPNTYLAAMKVQSSADRIVELKVPKATRERIKMTRSVINLTLRLTKVCIRFNSTYNNIYYEFYFGDSLASF